MLIIALFGIALSQNITWSNYSFSTPQFINLIAQQTNFARSFEEFGQILNFSIQYDSLQIEDLCSFQYQQLIFNRLENSFNTFVNQLQIIDIDELDTSDIEEGFQDQLVSYTRSDLNLLLLERNQVIHYLSYDQNSKLFNYSKFNLSIYSNTKQHQQLLNDRDAYFYVNNEQFSKFIIQNDSLYQFEILNWTQQTDQFKVLVQNNYVYLINGQQFLTIYQIVEHTLVLIKKLQAEDIYQVQKKMNLVDINIQEEYLYILDHENGVKRIHLNELEIDNDFFIKQPDCSIISIEKESIILIQHNQQRSIIFEGIINDKGWILLQSKQTFKKLIKSVKQLKDYAILLSNPINNIHRKYMIDSYADKTMLEGNDFYQMDFLGIESIDTNYLIGIFKYGVALYYQMEFPSSIVCYAQTPQISRVQISIISTQCPNKNESNLLNYCSSNLEYIFDIRGALMNEFQERIFIYLCIGASVIVTLLVVSIIYIIRRYQLKKEKINQIKRKGRRSK
ncbi:unnamed protein product [Paramecium primaurelia]|uniref:Transmembrane protein n=1 Tax=Paramecium primaurelia TaxID=5886 RepID=A0A8S1NQW9_PARPR|nr:unnamed protein product [Paramecium primaurelia]